MGLTIEVYAAEPQELVAIFSRLLTIASSNDHVDEENLLLDQLDTFPKALFPSRLFLPDDGERQACSHAQGI